MKALVHNPYWDSMGGGERYAAAFAHLLLKSKWQVDIYWPTNIADAVKQRFGIDVSQAAFTTQKKLSSYDLVFWVSDGSIPTSLAKKTIIHFQVPFHDQASATLSNKLKAKLYTVVCNSKFTKSFIDKTFNVNSHVIYPPVSVENIKSGKKVNQIISLARFSRRLHAKRQDILIDAFSKLKILNWKLVLAGGLEDKEYLGQLKIQATDLAVEFITSPDLLTTRKLLAESKIFWSATGFAVDEKQTPEKVEHFGITPVEAMAAGAVPIVTAKGGHLETITTDTGFLWNSLDELVAKTTQLANDAQLWEKLSHQSIIHSQKFSTQVFEEQFSKLIK